MTGTAGLRDTLNANLSPGHSLGLLAQVDSWEKNKFDNALANSMIDEDQEEEDKTESRGNTDNGFKGSGSGIMAKQSSNFSKLMDDHQLFGKDIVNSEYDEENDHSNELDDDEVHDIEFNPP